MSATGVLHITCPNCRAMWRIVVDQPGSDGVLQDAMAHARDQECPPKPEAGRAVTAVDELIAYVLIEDEDDSYDVGSHDAVMQLFADRAAAERVMAELIGKVRFMDPYRSRELWRDCDLSIEEMPVR